jgi:hypothetical protein
MSIKKGKDTRAHRSSRLLLQLERMLDSTLDSRQAFAWATTTKPKPLQVENYKVVTVVLISTGTGVFIVVQGGVTDLVKSITRKVMASWPSHVASRLWSSTSIDLQLGIPLYRLLESVTMKPTRERLHGRAGQPGGLAGRPPPRPTGQQSLHTDSSCQLHPRGDTYFDGIPNFLVIS